MPVTTYTDEELGLEPGWDQDENGQPLGRHIREALKSSRIIAKRAEAAEAEAAAAKRQLAFFKAGVPVDARGEFFAKGYDGPDDAESVKAAWEALWPSQAPTGEGQEQNQNDGTEAAQRIASAGEGATPPGQAGTVKFEDALRAARGNPEKLRELIANAPAEAGIKLPDVY